MMTDETHVLMGVTVEDLQQRINFVYELSKSQEGVELKEESDKLKAAIKDNPSICQTLLPEDLGKLVGIIKSWHSSARATAAENSPVGKRKKAAEEKAAAKKLLSKPITKEQMESDFDDL